MNKQQFERRLAIHDGFREEIEDLIYKYLKEFGKDRECIESWEIDQFRISVVTEIYYCGCCDSDYNEHYIPTSYIWDESWLEKAKEVKRLEAEKEKERKRQEKEKRAAEKRSRDHAEYLRLKKEFEPQQSLPSRK